MTQRPMHVLVPRLVDADNHNAQNLNAKAMLARFDARDIIWHCFHYHEADIRVLENPQVRCHALRKDRFWPWQLVHHYQRGYDAVFYTGNEWHDHYGLLLRRLRRRPGPVIATLEGLPGDGQREVWLSGNMGADIHCFRPRSGPEWIGHHDAVHSRADVTIAISAFLAQAGALLYTARVVTLPLGIDAGIFNTNTRYGYPKQTVVAGAGTLYEAKRPDIFLKLAQIFPGSEFVWYGEGPMRMQLAAMSKDLGLLNLRWPGAVSPPVLADAFRQASFFVLPSLSEGVPKVTQEANACGLPVVAFSSYGSPVVEHAVNGFSVATDDELLEHTGRLLKDPALVAKLGENGSKLALQWDWNVVAGRWQEAIRETIFRRG